jgi:putative aldouronate transport system substrate-binding protein
MGRIWYFMPWIRDNGRKVPETTEEFTDYLRWVKSGDPNGNGIADEIPMAFDTGDIRNVIAYFAKPFMPFVNTGSYFGLALDNYRNIIEQYKDPNFRESLKYLAGLYKESLILPDSFTMTRDQIKALSTSSTPILAVEAISWKTDSTPQTAERWIETFNLPPLRGPSGQRNAGNQDPWSIMGAMYIITDKCKNPELAIALYDYFLNFDVELDGYIGPKGTAWDDPDLGTTSLMGGEPYYKLLVAQGRQTNNTSWDQANPMIRSSKFRLGEQAVGAPEAKRWLETGDPSLRDFLLPNMSYAEEMWYFTSLENSKYAMPTELFIPPLSISDDDNARVSDILATLETYKDQVMVEFITGVRNINSDTDWNNYLAELDRQGSAEYVSILQKYIK